MKAFTRWFWDGSEASGLARALRVADFACAIAGTVLLIMSWNRTELFPAFFWLFVAMLALDLARRLVLRQSGIHIIGQAVATVIFAAMAVSFTLT